MLAENKVAIGQLGGLQINFACLKEEDIEVKCYALATIMHLSVFGMSTPLCCRRSLYSDGNNEEVSRLNGVPLVLNCLRATDADTRRYSVGALAVLCTNGLEWVFAELMLQSETVQRRSKGEQCSLWFRH